MSLGRRPAFLPSAILIHPAIWPQQTWAKYWGLHPLLGETELSPIQHNVAGAKAYLRAKFDIDPSNRLATVHQRHRQTDRQDSLTA